MHALPQVAAGAHRRQQAEGQRHGQGHDGRKGQHAAVELQTIEARQLRPRAAPTARAARPTATSRPSRPPPAASRIASAKIGRATSQRPAPSAPRTAISRRRLDRRASSRLAMLAHTMSSRNATAPISTSSAGRDAATSCSCAATTRALQPWLLSGWALAMRAGQHAELLLRLRHRRAVGQPRHHRQRAGPARRAVDVLRIEGQRRPHLDGGRGRELESGRHHADHGERHGVELDRRADDARIGAEHARPEAVADHDDAVGSDHGLVGRRRCGRARRRPAARRTARGSRERRGRSSGRPCRRTRSPPAGRPPSPCSVRASRLQSSKVGTDTRSWLPSGLTSQSTASRSGAS